MSAQIINGKEIARGIREELRLRVKRLGEERGVTPCLAVVLVGDDPASQTYVRNKERACNNLGILSRVFRMSETTSQEELMRVVHTLADDQTVHGILVQLPLPAHLDKEPVLMAIPWQKDVDGLHVHNIGCLSTGRDGFVACTAKGVLRLIKSTGQTIEGRHAVVIGRSDLVGKPTAMLLLNENATVTMCHSKTRDMPDITRQADILVAAVGKGGFVRGDMIKPGAIVIDVGTSRGADGKLHGDVDFEAAAKVAGYITPVPGGVGPMTIAMLLENTVEAGEIYG
ncbi:MAG: bifunctional methylenetetrahydrofolate dehydrogenase/methenyltetrahydrofolate cyclohydrolase FolD [Bacillota bacterium]